MSKLWIKICGITRAEDARAAVQLGADALGLQFYPPSPRVLLLEQLPEIVAPVPVGVRRVAVLVNHGAEEVESICAGGLIDMLQFHGDEPAGFCEQFGLPYIKAIKVTTGTDLVAAADEYASADMLLLDSFDKRVPGGTGKTFDWDLAAALVNNPGLKSRVKTVIAGGLKPGNVGEAVARLSPFGIDVSSGVESAPGHKSFIKMQAFIETARETAKEEEAGNG